MFQALDALKRALRREPLDAAVRAELHFSVGNQLREMNDLDQAFQVNVPLVRADPPYTQTTQVA